MIILQAIAKVANNDHKKQVIVWKILYSKYGCNDIVPIIANGNNSHRWHNIFILPSKSGRSDFNNNVMKFRTQIIGNKIVNYVEDLACFLKDGDIFIRPRSNTQYKFEKFVPDEKMVICENLETHSRDQIFCNSPVFKLTYL